MGGTTAYHASGQSGGRRLSGGAGLLEAPVAHAGQHRPREKESPVRNNTVAAALDGVRWSTPTIVGPTVCNREKESLQVALRGVSCERADALPTGNGMGEIE